MGPELTRNGTHGKIAMMSDLRAGRKRCRVFYWSQHGGPEANTLLKQLDTARV